MGNKMLGGFETCFERRRGAPDPIQKGRIDMKIARMKRTLISVAATAIVLGTAVAAASPVLARDRVAAAPIARIAYSDLNLATDAGIARLNARVRAAAERLCPSGGVEALDTRLDILACRDRVIAAAAPQVRRAIERFADARAAGGNLALAN
jgi:UrcA family protein